eukprot:TRINITY_DN67768_c10_g4_i1.p1 TRINITY_DN67768_c10_g4~~TRINITY_DN67768_c10_g4_i1.p1  ORF type:complete len:462 (+),score=13.01 TRINITY_DN67768_c10_g4_i1:22-1407(+)
MHPPASFWLLLLVVGLSSTLGKYEPNWKSLNSRPLPTWYDESKIGIFVVWGLYSVPSWGPNEGGSAGEWFWYWWKTGQKPYVDFMKKNYRPGFTYPDFAEQFTTELFNATEWVDLFKKSGAKYVVPTAKHHSGWCNYNTSVAWNWNSVDLGPRRDLIGELGSAVQSSGLHLGIYHSLFEWFNPLYLEDKKNNFKTTKFVDNVLQPQLHSIVLQYEPSLIWSDGDWTADDSYFKSKQFLAWLYNDSPVKQKVVVNDRWGKGDTCHNGGYWTCMDRYNPGKVINHKWENAMTLDRHSWGYRRNADLSQYLTLDDLLNELVSTVSCGGNILINVGPTADGRIPTIMQERLLGMGSWLSVGNGEAIYSTHPWRIQNATNQHNQNVWYTEKKGVAVYCFWVNMQSTTLTLLSPITTKNTAVRLLGHPGYLKWEKLHGTAGMKITVPDEAFFLTNTRIVGFALEHVL